MSTHNTSTVQDRKLTIVRVFDAPRSLMFKVWTQPQHFAHWLGPKDFTTLSCHMDVRLGGMYQACIRSPEGEAHWMQGFYREIVEPEHLVFTFAWEDENGQPGHETLVTVSFAEQDGKTRMTFQQAIFDSAEGRDSHHSGWSECFDRLEAYLANAPAQGID